MFYKYARGVILVSLGLCTFLKESDNLWAMEGQSEENLLESQLSTSCKSYDDPLEKGTLASHKKEKDYAPTEVLISVSASHYRMDGKTYKHVNELQIGEAISRVRLTYEEEGEEHTLRAHEVLKALAERTKIKSLVLEGKGALNEESISHIGRMTSLKTLAFEGDIHNNFCIIQCNNYAPWKTLRYLTHLDLEGTGFSEEPFVENFKAQYYLKKDLIFYEFIKMLPYLSQLKTLDISSNRLMPEILRKEEFGSPQEDFFNYDQWRKETVQNCARLLANNFKGSSLYISDACIEEVFFAAFTQELIMQPYTETQRRMDFSYNEIPPEMAIQAVSDFSKRKIIFDFSEI